MTRDQMIGRFEHEMAVDFIAMSPGQTDPILAGIGGEGRRRAPQEHPGLAIPKPALARLGDAQSCDAYEMN